MSVAARLGKNAGGYHGEPIDIRSVVQRMDAAARAQHWTRDAAQFEIAPGGQQLEFIAYRRENPQPAKRIYISTGIHGDEPAGPLALLQLLEEDPWPHDAALWACPCLNATGFPLNRRENALGVDLNRDYRHLTSAEIRAHTQWLERQPKFDLAICLHEDWESAGFYVYELNPEGRPSLAEKIIDAVEKVCPIDRASLIENWEASGGIIRPNVKPEERPQWAEALYLITHKTRLSYTLEAPSDFALEIRVQALVAGVRAALAAFSL